MTAKEKAEELVGKYFLQVQTLAQQKQCALIAIDEIYKTNLKHGAYLETDWDKTYYYSYWEQVKQEIENL